MARTWITAAAIIAAPITAEAMATRSKLRSHAARSSTGGKLGDVIKGDAKG
jgi:hypothetical protein